MALTVGSRLGHYTVDALIGEGGMGQVYQATDTKLNRQVALKILPEAFATDPDRLARFQREAQVLASLNHPNIGHIYGIEDSEGIKALVLELIEGPTLADRIAQGPIPVDEALPIAKQIAEALEAAHEAGVIHRDLKPANIKVRDDGTVKVLDFGLAKAFQPDASDPSMSQSPTISLTAAATQIGMVVGTAAYMAPEQAKGKVVDKRADVWAFGAVLYEMLSGQKPFVGEDVSDTLAAVLRAEVNMDGLPAETPSRLHQVLTACLQRDPKQRVHDIADVRLAMEGVFETAASAVAAPTAVRQLQVWQRPIPLAVAAITLAAITGLAVWSAMRPEPPRLVRFAVSPDAAEPLHTAVSSPDVAISPDGRRIAYLTRSFGFGAEQLHVRPLDQHTSETLVAQGELNSPFFSADGESVGFYDRRGGAGDQVMQRVSVRGGPVSTISELPGDLRGASWGADETIVFAAGNTSGLWRVAAVGGEPEPLTSPDVDQGAIAHLWPQFLPGGEAVLFTIVANPIEESQIAVLSLDTGEQTVVLRGGSYPRYTSTGHLLYVSQGNLWAVGFDPSRLETIGVPVPVQEGVLTKSPQGAANFDVSGDGALIYVPGSMSLGQGERTLVWVDREGQEEAIPAPPAPYESPRLSPDGRYIAVEVRNPGNTDVMVYDLQRDTLTRLTFDPSADGYPLWSPDGQRVLFSSDREGTANLYSRTADGTGQAERVTTSEAGQFPQSFSPDGRSVVVMTGDDIEVIGIGDESRADRLLETEFEEFYPQVSPDGRWITYSSNESGASEVYVRPFPNIDDGRWQISRDGGYSPVWSHDGRELFFRRSGTVEMMVVAVDTEPTFAPGNPQLLFQAPYRGGNPSRGRPWDVTEGGRFLMIDDQVRDQARSFGQINVVLNWHQELLERVPID